MTLGEILRPTILFSRFVFRSCCVNLSTLVMGEVRWWEEQRDVWTGFIEEGGGGDGVAVRAKNSDKKLGRGRESGAWVLLVPVVLLPIWNGGGERERERECKCENFIS